MFYFYPIVLGSNWQTSAVFTEIHYFCCRAGETQAGSSFGQQVSFKLLYFSKSIILQAP